MKFSKENVMKLLEHKEQEELIGKSDDYIKGYADAIKEIKFIINVVWD